MCLQVMLELMIALGMLLMFLELCLLKYALLLDV